MTMMKTRVRMIGDRIRTVAPRLRLTGVDLEGDRAGARLRGYNAQWDKASATFKKNHPWCLGCEAMGKRTAVEVVDHVEPHRSDQLKFWNSERWQPACRWHHDAVKKRMETMFDRGEITVMELWLNSRTAVALSRRLAHQGEGV